MEQSVYNLTDITLSGASLLVAATSLLLTFIGLVAVYFQIEKIKESALTNIHTKWCDQSFDIIQFFANKPGIRDYFYCNKILGSEVSEEQREYIYYAAEILANFIDQLLLQKTYLPEKQWEVWNRFIKSSFNLSVVLIDFIIKNREWYSDELLNIAEESASKQPI